MTTQTEALKLALEALKDLQLCTDDYYESSHEASKKGDKAITAIKEALAQPEQEPVAWLDGPHLVMREDWRNRSNYKGPYVGAGRAIPDSWVPTLYTTPPQRTWVGLDWNEMPEIYMNDKAFEHGAQWAEAKLKEKNT